MPHVVLYALENEFVRLSRPHPGTGGHRRVGIRMGPHAGGGQADWQPYRMMGSRRSGGWQRWHHRSRPVCGAVG